MPTLIVWGERDRIIPVQHVPKRRTRAFGAAVSEVFEAAGHFPYLDCPFRFVSILTDFIRSTKPADVDAVSVADEIRDRAAPRPAGEGSAATSG